VAALADLRLILGGRIVESAAASEPAPVLLESVAWIWVRDGLLLAARSHHRDVFYLPGGKLEAGETYREALVREVEEEVGIELEPSSIAELFTINDVAHGLVNTRLAMRCFRAMGAGEPEASREIAALEWIAADSIDRCAPAVQQVVRRLRDTGELRATLGQ
jgi:8-oxo-dGTP diphosphatase